MAQVTIRNRSELLSSPADEKIPRLSATAETRKPMSPRATIAQPRIDAGYSDLGFGKARLLLWASEPDVAILLLENRTSQTPHRSLARTINMKYTIPREMTKRLNSCDMGIEKPREAKKRGFKIVETGFAINFPNRHPHGRYNSFNLSSKRWCRGWYDVGLGFMDDI